MAGYVLVVDDEAPIREFIEMALTDEGYEVRVAADGKEALAMIEQEQPAVILLDMMMPVMDGRTFLTRYDEMPIPQVDVIAMSAVDTTLDRQTLTRLAGFLPKPFSLTDLIECVETHMTRSR